MNKFGTPIKSVDSAMDSLEDSPPGDGGQQLNRHNNGGSRAAWLASAAGSHLRPSSSNNFQQAVDLISGASTEPCSAGGWDSGLSSAPATDSQPSHRRTQQQQQSGDGSSGGKVDPGQDKCCDCQLAINGGGPSCCSNSPQSSSAGSGSLAAGRRERTAVDRDKEDWVRILEALETVGEEEMLRKLEECILTQAGQPTSSNSNYGSPAKSNHQQQHHSPAQLLPSECGVLSRRFAPGLDNANGNYCSLAAPTCLISNGGISSNGGVGSGSGSGSRPSLLRRPPMSPPTTMRSSKEMLIPAAAAADGSVNGSRQDTMERPAANIILEQGGSRQQQHQQQRQQQSRSQPGTPVLGARNATFHHHQQQKHSGELLLPPPMPSPRAPAAPLSFPPHGFHICARLLRMHRRRRLQPRRLLLHSIHLLAHRSNNNNCPRGMRHKCQWRRRRRRRR